MEGFYFLLPTLMAIFMSMLIVRAGAIALVLTGLRYEQAKFQALSAFTATGFTTRAAEQVVNHPTRRRIISLLMIGGYAGIATVIVSATSSFTTTTAGDVPLTILLLVVGIIGIYLIGTRTGLMRRWEDFVEGQLHRKFALQFEPAEELLHIAEGFGLVRLEVGTNSPLLDQSIPQIGGKRKDTLILGVERKRSWIPARKMKEPLQLGDQLVIYGELERLKAEFDSTEEQSPA